MAGIIPTPGFLAKSFRQTNLASETPTGLLTLRAGTFRRTTGATREGAFRDIKIANCTVTSWSVYSDDTHTDKLGGHSFRRDQQLHVSIREAKLKWWKEDPERIGTLGIGDYMQALDRSVPPDALANVIVPPDAFALLWTAAQATDGSTRHIQFELKPWDENFLSVTNVGLIENMPPPPVEGSLHPVVAELRSMREQLRKEMRFWTILFAIAFWLWVLSPIFSKIFR